MEHLYTPRNLPSQRLHYHNSVLAEERLRANTCRRYLVFWPSKQAGSMADTQNGFSPRLYSWAF